MDFPADLLYSEDHEWLRIDDREQGLATVGITDFAQSELGEIVYVEVETVGETLESGDEFGTVEAVKTTSDLFMPVSGEVLEINPDLEDTPESINEAPYEAGWIIKIKISGDWAQVEESLMSAEQYQGMVSA